MHHWYKNASNEKQISKLDSDVSQMKKRIDKALEVAMRYAGDEGHHKAWVIDQMVRELTGCPMVKRESEFKNAQGETHIVDTLGESEEYLKLVKEACAGEDGPDSYDWNEGIAP
jgi:hypothetical protein